MSGSEDEMDASEGASSSQAQKPTRKRIREEQVGAQPVALAPTKQKAKAPVSPTEMARRVDEATRKRKAEAPANPTRQIAMRSGEFQRDTHTSGPTAQEQLETSQRERQASLYTDLLINGKPGVWGGLMRKRNMQGDDNLPFDHQRIFVKRFIPPDVRFMILGHDMGLGKTASALQAVAAMSLVYRRVPKCVIVVPSAVREQWMDGIFDWLRVPRTRVFSTSCLADVTPAKLKKIDILVITRDCVSNAYGTCFSRQERIKETAHGNRKVMEWLRTPGTPMHCLFNPPTDEEQGWKGYWDLGFYDEAHYFRNGESRWCEAANELSRHCSKRMLLSGTFVVNKPSDLAGLCKAGGAPRDAPGPDGPVDLQDRKSWAVDRNYQTINRTTVKILRKYIDRATEKILNLPPVDQCAIDFDVHLNKVDANEYNSALAAANSLKVQVEQSGKGPSAKDLTRLMSLLQMMQQMIVSPLLAELGAAKFRTEEGLVERAADPDKLSGSLNALRAEIETLRSEGHRRIVISADHVMCMRIAKKYFETNCPAFGKCLTYDGTLSQKSRVEAKREFLHTDHAILFLSIRSGGVGLHLVPGCEAMIFWGSMPFSPAHVNQCLKRIHRIGQSCPLTRERGYAHVTIRHLVPYGGVDAALARMHADKKALIKLVQEDDDSGFKDNTDNQWRKCGRILDACQLVAPSPDNPNVWNFPEMPLYKKDDRGHNTTIPFTLIDDVVTRGREPTPGALAAADPGGPSSVLPPEPDMLGANPLVDAANAMANPHALAGIALS